MSNQEYKEIIERLARIEEKVTYITSSGQEVKYLVAKHETDIQRAKGALLFVSILSSIGVFKAFLSS